MSTVMIDGVEYEPVKRAGERLCIVVVDNRGLTFVGRFNPHEYVHGSMNTIRDARCVIRWGTTEHLAELASEGPKSNTKLGRARSVSVTEIIACYVCEEESLWQEF